MSRLFGAVALGVLAVLATPVAAGAVATTGAHPLGNFTTNTAAAMVISTDEVRIGYVVDLAEIPALREIQAIDDDGDGEVDPTEADEYATTECGSLAAGLRLEVDRSTVALEVVRSAVTTPAGVAGLDTLRLECRLAAHDAALDGETTVRLTDENFADRAGWREITAVGDGTTLVDPAVPSVSPTDALRAYPAERLGSPLDQTTVTLTARPGGDRIAPDVTVPPGAPRSALPGAERFAAAFTDLVARQELTVPFVVVALLSSILLGSLHALAPGHGKTVMAAYLIGKRADRRLSLVLGLTVASSHTLGVVVLGVLISASERFAPEELYPLLGAASGLLFASIGIGLLRGALARRRAGGPFSTAHAHLDELDAAATRGEHGHDPARALAPAAGVTTAELAPLADPTSPAAVASAVAAGIDHAPDHHHGHSHSSSHSHSHGHHHHLAADGERPSWRSVLAPGIAGGLVPSPSALLVFIAGVALGRAWFGLLLVLAYGVGVGLSLVGAGYLLVKARDAIERRVGAGSWIRVERFTAVLPVLTAVLVVAGGAWIALRALTAT